ncbi:MAG: hypothetical protein JRN19_03660 [Nitrososphaerota archaeon]|nr:hypothetical protein [Nitrososphaerota archaeon]
MSYIYYLSQFKMISMFLSSLRSLSTRLPIAIHEAGQIYIPLYVLISGPLGSTAAIIIIAVLVISILALFYGKEKRATRIKRSVLDTINIISIGIATISGAGLLVDVPALQTAGFLHWAVLLIYISILIFLTCTYFIRRVTRSLPLISLFSSLMAVLMLIDIFGNLPVSDYYNALPNFGLKYLLGFGAAGTASSFWVSLAFVLLLAASVLQAAMSLVIWRRVKQARL